MRNSFRATVLCCCLLLSCMAPKRKHFQYLHMHRGKRCMDIVVTDNCSWPINWQGGGEGTRIWDYPSPSNFRLPLLLFLALMRPMLAFSSRLSSAFSLVDVVAQRQTETTSTDTSAHGSKAVVVGGLGQNGNPGLQSGVRMHTTETSGETTS